MQCRLRLIHFIKELSSELNGLAPSEVRRTKDNLVAHEIQTRFDKINVRNAFPWLTSLEKGVQF